MMFYTKTENSRSNLLLDQMLLIKLVHQFITQPWKAESHSQVITDILLDMLPQPHSCHNTVYQQLKMLEILPLKQVLPLLRKTVLKKPKKLKRKLRSKLPERKRLWPL